MSEEINSEEMYDNSKIIKLEDYEIQILHKLYFFFLEYNNTEYIYKESLSYILSMLNDKNPKEKSIMNDLFDILKNYIQKKFETHNLIYKSIEDNIIKHLDNFVENESLLFEKIKNELTTSQTDYKLLKKDFEDFENDYNLNGINNILKISEEIEKSKKEINKKLDSILDKYKKENLGKKLEQYRINYIKGINKFNQCLEDYIKKSESSYKNFKTIRENYMFQFIISIKQFIENEKNLKENLSLINEYESFVNNIELEKDLNNFLKENTILIQKPEKAEFHSLASSCEDKEQFKEIKLKFKDYPLVIPKLKDLINQEFCYFSPLLNHHDLEKRKKFIKINDYVNKLVEGKLESDNIDDIKILLNEKEEYIDFVLFQLNKIRFQLKNLFPKQYNFIKNILNEILDIYQKKEKDYPNMSLLILLSQTFYKVDENSRILMEEDLKIHPILKKEEIWKKLIEKNINKELKPQVDDNFEPIILDEAQIGLKLFSVLSSFKVSLEDFGFNKLQIKNIFKPFVDKYKIPDYGNFLSEYGLISQGNKEEKKDDEIKKEEIKIEEKKLEEEIKIEEEKKEEIKIEEEKKDDEIKKEEIKIEEEKKEEIKIEEEKKEEIKIEEEKKEEIKIEEEKKLDEEIK